MSKEQMDLAWTRFKQVVQNAQYEKDCEQKWSQWSKITWQSRQIAKKQHNLKARMRAL